MKRFKYLKSILSTLSDENKKIAELLVADKLIIDSFELESLINPDKFDFASKKIDTIGVELD